ncbi:MAG: hypothetical protein K9K86_04655 [Pseudomonadales bacterium]|nr:hypothetical protein [Pseudomonadales bacterium]
MSKGQLVLKKIHKKQKDMIGLLERFEEMLLTVEYSPKRSNGMINRLFSSLQSRIDAHLKFETAYLLPLLNEDMNQRTLAGLVEQRALILNLITSMHRLMEGNQSDDLGICAWDEFIDHALTLIRATFSLFHWEELEFLGCAQDV